MATSTATPKAVESGHNPFIVAALLFVSGGCALTYQITWLRLLRLVFGYSTAASAAALGIFMGGLGVGAIVLGRRADSHPDPLRFYARLELAIAGVAAVTPFLLAAVRWIYTASGGSAQLGLGLATLLRLALSSMVLAAPTFFIGGTLSAAARAVEVTGEHRWRTALLYGSNTLGAVCGVLLANFIFLELLGTRFTLLLAAAINGLIAWAAFSIAQPIAVTAEPAPVQTAEEPGRALRGFVLVAAGVAGFAFLLMEIVWYRMLTPLLGGSTYTFGVILAVALAGVGSGGLLYAVEARRGDSFGVGRLGLVTALEGLFCIAPFALGDRVAILAVHQQPASAGSFLVQVAIWVLLACIVIFPMALVSGYQFPLFIGLAGQRVENVGTQVGRVYGLNTAGAITGSLAGGFGVLPGIGALGAWRLAAVSLSLLAAGGAWLAWTRREHSVWVASPLFVATIAVALCWTTGPTAFWRHQPIGVIGLAEAFGSSPNAVRRYLNDARRGVVWEEDGVESSVALTDEDAFSLMINGKSDGNAISDVSTMIMIGELPAIFHDQPKHVLVIGLGLGTTAGWLAMLPSVESVDVIELEPAVLRAARDTTQANFDVMTNPKVHILIGDAREFLLTTKSRYDIIASEPSNPYRAGVASLFTVEFYEAAKEALAPNGVFAQWLQAYAANLAIIRAVYATMATVFDSVESWEVQLGNDLLLMAREHDIDHDVARLRERVDTEPYRSGLQIAWGVSGVEGLYSGFLGNAELARAIRRAEPTNRLNTDDGTLIEYECARSLGRSGPELVHELRVLAAQQPGVGPPFINGSVDVTAAAEARVARAVHEVKTFTIAEFRGDASASARVEARAAYAAGDFDGVRTAWGRQQSRPVYPIDVMLLAYSLAVAGDRGALPLAEQLRSTSPGDADAIAAFYHSAVGDREASTNALKSAFDHYRTVPWGHRPLRRRAFGLAWSLTAERPEAVTPLLEGLRQPFAAHVLEDQRFYANAAIALDRGPKERCADAIESAEPWVYWTEDYLRGRLECYERVGGPYLQRARDDLAEFLAGAAAASAAPGDG